MASPPICMMSWRHDGSFWLSTGTPQVEPPPVVPGVAAGAGDDVSGEAPAPVRALGPGWPLEDSTPCRTPTRSLAVQHSEAEWPLAKTSRGRSEIFCGRTEESVLTVQISKPAPVRWLASRPT